MLWSLIQGEPEGVIDVGDLQYQLFENVPKHLLSEFGLKELFPLRDGALDFFHGLQFNGEGLPLLEKEWC